MIYIPAFWWYSISYSENTTTASFKYRTYMNNVAIFPKLCMKFLQTQNVKRQIAPVHLQSDQSASTSIQEDENTDKKEN